LAKNKDWVAFDVETERLHYEVRGGWDNPAGFGFTVGASVDCEGNERLYDSRRDDMNARDALARDLLTYDRIVSFNGKGFDNPVIAAGDDVVLAQLNERAWDMKLLIDKELGINPKGEVHVVSLEALSKATLGDSKTLPDGRDAVRLWRKGEYATVAKYNVQDAKLTAGVWLFGLQHGFVLFEPARLPIWLNPDTRNGGGGLIVVKVKASWKR